ncbi:MAG: CsiV family protein [Nevskiaceae bacterium]
MTIPSRLARALLLAAMLPSTALAERYRVDVIVFADRSAASGESSQPAQSPDAARTFEPWEVVPLRNAGIEILEDELFGLMDAWKRLGNSRNHEPLVRIAWIQKDPPAERGVALRLRHGKPLVGMTATGSAEFYPVDGWVALLAGRFLHLDASFVHTQALEDGELRSFRLRERRRLRREELHHLDSPRIGLIVRAQRADPPLKPAPAKPASKKKN